MFEQIIGAALVLLFLADVFMTVLYARAGTGLLAPFLNRALWACLQGTANQAGRRRGAVLSLAGPIIVVSLISFWALGLTLGAALIIRPELGTAIRPSSGETPTDFVTALLVAGNSLSIVGGSNYSPYTTGTRIVFLINSLIGTSVLSLVLSYLVQVYSALRERNSLALTVHLMSGSTGDAAELLARLAPDGDFSDAQSELSNLARSLASVKEAHHFWPLLFYFRFKETFYAVSRFSFVILDLVALIESAVEQSETLVRSAPVASLRQGTLLLMKTLDRGLPTKSKRPEPISETYLQQSYVTAAETLERAGIRTRSDGTGTYVADRLKWEPLIRRVAPTLGYAIDEIDRRTGQNCA